MRPATLGREAGGLSAAVAAGLAGILCSVVAVRLSTDRPLTDRPQDEFW